VLPVPRDPHMLSLLRTAFFRHYVPLEKQRVNVIASSNDSNYETNYSYRHLQCDDNFANLG
jgi:hypothetical protein